MWLVWMAVQTAVACSCARPDANIVYPADGEVGVSVDVEPVLLFNQGAPDPFEVSLLGPSGAVDAVFERIDEGRQSAWVLHPTAPLEPSTDYSVVRAGSTSAFASWRTGNVDAAPPSLGMLDARHEKGNGRLGCSSTSCGSFDLVSASWDGGGGLVRVDFDRSPDFGDPDSVLWVGQVVSAGEGACAGFEAAHGVRTFVRVTEVSTGDQLVVEAENLTTSGCQLGGAQPGWLLLGLPFLLGRRVRARVSR